MADFGIKRDGCEALVALGAKLTAVEVPSLQNLLREELAAGVTIIVFNLADTATLDSTGIGLLVAANNSLGPMAGSIRMTNVCVDIMKLLQSMRLVDRLHASAPGKD